MAAQKRYELTDEEWERLRGYFPGRAEGQLGRSRNEDRQILNGILWIVRSGAAWRELPELMAATRKVFEFAFADKSNMIETYALQISMVAPDFLSSLAGKKALAQVLEQMQIFQAHH